MRLSPYDISSADGRDPTDDMLKIDAEREKYSDELSKRPQIVVANKIDSADMESDAVKAFIDKCAELGREVVYVSAVTGEGLDEMVKLAAEKLKELPPVTVYEPEFFPEENVANEADVRETTVKREGGKFVVEGQWLFNFMANINFSDYESLNFFQRVLVKNGVIDKLREAGVEEGDTVSIYDFEFDFVY